MNVRSFGFRSSARTCSEGPISAARLGCKYRHIDIGNHGKTSTSPRHTLSSITRSSGGSSTSTALPHETRCQAISYPTACAEFNQKADVRHVGPHLVGELFYDVPQAHTAATPWPFRPIGTGTVPPRINWCVITFGCVLRLAQPLGRV